MCGIAGYQLRNLAHLSRAEAFLNQASRLLAHRGPDGAGTYFSEDRSVGLLHRRLNIMDATPSGHQPLSAGGLHLTYNGEIYNYKQLAQKYDYPSRPANDTVVLHHLFLKKKSAALAEVDGMFAAAFYDETEKRLYLVRDPAGIKPLLYHLDPAGNLFFASELKALLPVITSKEINPYALTAVLFYEFTPGKDAIFSSVQKLLPGQILSRNHEESLKSDFFANFLTDFPPADFPSEKNFTDLWEDTVVSHLEAQVPVGFLFSGGADSTAVVGAVNRRLPEKKIHTFSVTFDRPDFDELPYIRKLNHIFEAESLSVPVAAARLIPLAERLTDYFDEPFAVPGVIPMLELSRAVSESGFRSVLSGDGGDEMFLGYGSYLLAQKAAGYPYQLPGVFPLLRAGLSRLKGERYRRAARYFASDNGTGFEAHLWSQSQDMFMLSEIKKVFPSVPKDAGDYLRSFWEEAEAQLKELTRRYGLEKNISAGEKSLRLLNLFDRLFYFPGDLMYKTDISSMAFGVEVRVPFMSRRLMPFQGALQPLDRFIWGKEQKLPLKKMLASYLPADLVYRPKWGFPAPVGSWLQNEWSALAQKYTSEKRLKLTGFFNPMEVHKLVHRPQDAKRLWAVMGIEMWAEKYLR